MYTLTAEELTEAVIGEGQTVLANALPRVMAGVLLQAAIFEWPTLIAQAVVTLAVEEAGEPEQLLTDIMAAILAAIPQARELTQRRDARFAELFKMIQALPEPDRRTVGNALGL